MIAAAGPFEPVDGEMVQPVERLWLCLRPGSTEDIFVHMETVRRAGLAELCPASRCVARVAPGHKGPLAVLIDDTGNRQRRLSAHK